MGVLKVWTGSEWRKIGCGTVGIPPGTSYTFHWEQRPHSGGSTATRLHWFDGSTAHVIGTNGASGSGWTVCSETVTASVVQGAANQARLDYLSGLDTCDIRRMRLVVDGVTYYGEFPDGYPYTSAVQDGVVGNPKQGEVGPGLDSQYDAQTGAHTTASLPYVSLVFDIGRPGRLKLWTGSEWLVEACDDSAGVRRPLKVNVGTASVPVWETVACMVFSAGDDPDAGVYDTAAYDLSTYG